MADEKTKLAVIDGETLMDMKLPPTKFCVDTLLPQGLCILGGASNATPNAPGAASPTISFCCRFKRPFMLRKM